MATIDISRKGGRHKKRDVSVAAYYISESEIAKLIDKGEAAATDTFQLAMLPDNALIIASATTVLVPFTVAATLNCGIAGGTQFAAAVALNAAADTVVAGSGDISRQPASLVDMTMANAAGIAVDGGGYAVVTVEYIEHEQCSGELTNFVSG